MADGGDWHRSSVRVRYGETDRMGVVWHGTYLTYFEHGRTEFMRDRGLTYRSLEEQGVLLMVSEADIRWLAPATYDDLLRVDTRVAEAGPASVTFEYRVAREDADGESILATGTTRLACTTPEGRVRRLPRECARLLDGSAA